MRRGERIELLKKIADRLGAEDYSWDDMRLVLRQFGFPLADPEDWRDSTRAYVLWSIEDGSDEALVELDEYLYGGSSRETLDPTNLPWEAGTFRLFISHTSVHKALASDLATYFRTWRIHAFVAHETIEPAREWERVIEAALGSCHALTALITNDFGASKWCDQEVGFALARRVPIIPVRVEADPHGFIGKFQAARVERPGNAAWIADGIFRALARHAGVRGVMAAPVVHRFAATMSFDGARANFPLLQDLPVEVWTPELVELTERAIADNGQLREANLTGPPLRPVPDATRELLAPVRTKLGLDRATVPSADDDIPF